MEGGGDSREGKARLRQGMSEFLRSLRKSAGHKRLSWKIVACGSRNEAHGVFLNATMTATEIFNVLLVRLGGASGTLAASGALPLSPGGTTPLSGLRPALRKTDRRDRRGIDLYKTLQKVHARRLYFVA